MRAVDRDLLRKLEAAATPGPWTIGDNPATIDGVFADAPTTHDDEGPGYLVAWFHSDYRELADARFIAALRNAAPELLAADTLSEASSEETE